MMLYGLQLLRTLCMVAIVGGPIVLGISAYHIMDDLKTDWRPVRATLTGYQPYAKPFRGASYAPCVHYEFHVDGETHQGRHCGGGFDGRQTTPEKAEAVAQRRFGHVTTIYYDPADPTRTRLRQSVMSVALPSVAAGVMAIAIGVPGLLMTHRRVRLRRATFHSTTSG